MAGGRMWSMNGTLMANNFPQKILLVGIDDLLDERVPDDVASVEL